MARPANMNAYAWTWDMCMRDDRAWLTTHSTYKLATGEMDASQADFQISNRGLHMTQPGFFVTDKEQRGFILVEPMGDNWFEMYFALVDEPHRRKGVLREMVREMESTLPAGATIWLECNDESVPCWEALGFSPCEKKTEKSATDTCPYEFMKVVRRNPGRGNAVSTRRSLKRG